MKWQILQNHTYSHNTGSGISEGCGCGHVWNHHTPFLPTGCCFSHQPTGRSHSVFLVPGHLYLWKGICSSRPLRATGVLLPWNSPFQIFLFHQCSALDFPTCWCSWCLISGPGSFCHRLASPGCLTYDCPLLVHHSMESQWHPPI